MTVYELIKILSEHPPSALVAVRDEEYDWTEQVIVYQPDGRSTVFIEAES